MRQARLVPIAAQVVNKSEGYKKHELYIPNQQQLFPITGNESKAASPTLMPASPIKNFSPNLKMCKSQKIPSASLTASLASSQTLCLFIQLIMIVFSNQHSDVTYIFSVYFFTLLINFICYGIYVVVEFSMDCFFLFFSYFQKSFIFFALEKALRGIQVILLQEVLGINGGFLKELMMCLVSMAVYIYMLPLLQYINIDSMKQSEQKPQQPHTNPPEHPIPGAKPTTSPPQLKQPYYTFSFDSYYSEHYKQHKKNYLKRLRIRTKLFAIAGLTILVLGNIYPLMMWFEYDINVRKPRVSQYLLNRLN